MFRERLSRSARQVLRAARKPSASETATRVVAAVGAQFPEQTFVTIRHPRVETVADLQLALARMETERAVVIFTVVEPTLREAMRDLCHEANVEYCDLLSEPLEAVALVTTDQPVSESVLAQLRDNPAVKFARSVEFHE